MDKVELREALVKVNYPLNKEQARVLQDMTTHPGWSIFLECLKFEANVYKQAALNTPYGPDAIEKFRFSQGIAQNLERIPAAIIESLNAVLDESNSLSGVYDSLYLND